MAPGDTSTQGTTFRKAKGPKGPPKNAKWSSSCDAILIDTLRLEQAKGNQADNSWKACVWTACEKSLEGSEKISGGALKKAKGCQDHWALLRSHCLAVQKLVNLSGWGWDNTRRCVSATDEQWATYIQAHPASAYWRDRAFPVYEDILGLIEGRVATGVNAIHHLPEMLASSPALSSFHGSDCEADSIPPIDTMIDGLLPLPDGPESPDKKLEDNRITIEGPSFVGKFPPQTPAKLVSRHDSSESIMPSASSRLKKKRLTGPVAVQDVAEALRDVATSMRSTDEASSTDLSTPQRRKCAIQLLANDGELSDHESIQAFCLFRRDSTVADTYLSIPQKRLRTAYIQEEVANTL
ncbi:hypothetical protein M378DRAFT_107808 [Amanita muscaria Koide BX008]|uniref:Myb/SANT-like domain-containing protein n=1 Tax=Amanita muscaria (strain Koide BX008) TaxID=946122 RepID=A0A0C2T8S4_AMAMK|nr:hypothetical protein M378DRAFT_107808 [Amanita muscaria Koide BX008]